MKNLLENNRIVLRAVEPEDLPLLYRWENNAEWWEHGNMVNPFSKYILRQYIENSGQSIYESKQLRLMIMFKETCETVGMIDLFDFDPHHNRVGVGVLIDKEHQKKQLANDAFELLLAYCFDFLAVRTVFANVPVSNEPSLKMLTKLGFVQTGLLKDWVRKEDKYMDVAVMQKFKD